MSERSERIDRHSAPIYRSGAGARAVEQRYREILDRWPVPYERLTVPTREGPTSVVVCGPPDAPPVLAVQGSGGNAAMWLRQIPVWAERLRVHAVDVIGEPGLSAPSRPPLDSGAYAAWLDDVLRELGVAQVSLVGVSFGGWLALDYATRRPERVTRLALLNPGGVGRQRIRVPLTSVLLRPFGAWGRRRTLRMAIGPAARTAPRPDGNELALAGFVLLIFKHFRPRMGALPVFDDDTLRRLTMPVLAVVGGRDAMTDARATARRIEATVPRATVRLLPDAGHILPDQSAAVLDFLGSPDQAAHRA
jgi:pimeloyl-ACP methyl ester carboxylesterase